MKIYILLCFITSTCIAMDSKDPAPSPPLQEPGIIELLSATFAAIKVKMKAHKIYNRGTYYCTPGEWPYSLSVTVQDDDPIQELHYTTELPEDDTVTKSGEILKMIKKLATDTYKGYRFKDRIKNATHKGFVCILDNGVVMALFHSKKWILRQAQDDRGLRKAKN